MSFKHLRTFAGNFNRGTLTDTPNKVCEVADNYRCASAVRCMQKLLISNRRWRIQPAAGSVNTIAGFAVEQCVMNARREDYRIRFMVRAAKRCRRCCNVGPVDRTDRTRFRAAT